MKSAKEKEMSDEEYKTLREEYDKKADQLGNKIKKAVLTFLGIYAASFVIIFIYSTFRNNFGVEITYMWLGIEFLLAIFLYDPKAEADKKQQYETDKTILLDSVRSRITSYKIKMGLVIGLGIFFLFLNVVWWMVFGAVPAGNAPVSDFLRIYTALSPSI